MVVNKWLKGLACKFLSTKRLVVESLDDIETSIFKALLAYHFLKAFGAAFGGLNSFLSAFNF